MLQRLTKLHGLLARLSRKFNGRPRRHIAGDAREFQSACRELAFWSASDAGLEGRIEAFDGSVLHAAADGMCTLRMLLRDSTENRSPAEAAAAIFRPLADLRVLLLIEIDGYRFVKIVPNVNAGVRELGASFANRTGRAG